MTNWMIAGILFLIIGSAVAYIIREKRKGVKCIGCPSGCHCPGKGAGSCSGCLSDTRASQNSPY